MTAPRPSLGRHVLLFKDEAPAIGSGCRTVEIERLGYKWVRLRNPYTHRTARIRRARFDEVWANNLAFKERNANPVPVRRVSR